MPGRRISRAARIAVSLGVVFLMHNALPMASSGTPPAQLQPQPQPPGTMPAHAPTDALDLGLLTITNDLSFFAGQYVRIVNARVYDVISPRMFIVEPSGVPSSQLTGSLRVYDNRAIVVLESPVSTIRKGELIEVVGRPWTLAGARVQLDRTAMADLSDRNARRFAYKPIIGADLVRTPDGIDLFSHPPR